MAREFSHTGNGYVYGANLPDYAWMADERGWVNVSDFTAEQLRDIVGKAINSLKDEPFTDNKQEVVIIELAKNYNSCSSSVGRKFCRIMYEMCKHIGIS